MKRSTLLLTALTMVFLAQFVRLLLPSLIWYLEEDLKVTVAQSAAIWYGPFVLSLAVPLLARRFGPRGALWIGGLGVILCRVVMEQAWTAQVVIIAAAMGGIGFCVGLLPVLYGVARAQPGGGWRGFAAGMLLGLSLDTAVRGLSGTLDLVWVHGPWARVAVVVLLVGFAYLLWQTAREAAAPTAATLLSNLPLVGVGLFVFVEWLIVQNQGWVESFTGWPAAAALGWLTLGNIGALAAAGAVWANPPPRFSRCWAVVPGGALTLALVLAATPGWVSALAVMVGLVCSAILLAIISGTNAPAAREGAAGASIAIWLGMLLFATILVVYTLGLVVQLPFPSSALAPAAAVGLTFCALAAAGPQPLETIAATSAWTPARLSALLLLAPLSLVIGEAISAPATTPAQGYPVRVMTYNIRDGFGLSGRQDLEALARVIETGGADVVGLQEVGRGTLFDSGADVLALLSRRLNMPYMVMETATDPLFGDAILSRYPIVVHGQGLLPRVDALIVRGYAWAQIDLGGGNNLLVITTHLDSRAGPSGSREREAETQGLLSVWAGRLRTVVLGDMNSRLGSPEMQVLLDGGFRDAWAEAGQGERQPIDWIFHTPDLAAREAMAINSPASDHFAVVVTLEPKP
jgi:endonuclease/exonuclease/phosphatase family metal-dependent hydrolase